MVGAAGLIVLMQLGATTVGLSDPAAAQASLTVCATVKDSTAKGPSAGSPIPGATVIVVTPAGTAVSGTAGSDGCVAFLNLAAGPHKVTVVSPGTQPVDGAVEVPPAGGARFDAALA